LRIDIFLVLEEIYYIYIESLVLKYVFGLI
jgi:hypothetical protein